MGNRKSARCKNQTSHKVCSRPYLLIANGCCVAVHLERDSGGQEVDCYD